MARTWRHRVLSWFREVGALLLLVLAVDYLVLPRVVQARSEISMVGDVSVLLVVAALGLEALSLASYTALTLTALPRERQPRYRDQLRVDLTGLGASHVLPGGGATAAALRLRLMTIRGVSSDDALSATAVETALSIPALMVTFGVGVVLALPGIDRHPWFLVSGLAALVLVGLAVVLTSGPRRPLFERPAAVLGERATSLLARVRGWGSDLYVRTRTLLQQPYVRRRGAAYALGNWLFDAACLWVCLAAFGIHVAPGPLLAAYGAANLLALLPLTPGGLGVVEAFLIPTLISLGASGGPVVLGVLLWRLFEFWLPVPVAGLAWLSLRIGDLRRTSHSGAAQD
jgi:putative heme transporter